MSGNSVLTPTSLAKEGNQLASEQIAQMESDFIRNSVEKPTFVPRNAVNSLLRDKFKNGVYQHTTKKMEDYSLLIVFGAVIVFLLYYHS